MLNYIKKSNNILFPSYLSSSNSYDEFFLNYHLFTCELLRKYIETNKQAIKDKFFKNLINDLKPRLKLKKPLTIKFIENLNKKMIK